MDETLETYFDIQIYFFKHHVNLSQFVFIFKKKLKRRKTLLSFLLKTDNGFLRTMFLFIFRIFILLEAKWITNKIIKEQIYNPSFF